MALTLNDIVSIAPDSPRKHTEKHGMFISNVDIFRVIPWLFTRTSAQVSTLGLDPNGTYSSDVVPNDLQFATEAHGKTRNIHQPY
jgi:hypothetical protein